MVQIDEDPVAGDDGASSYWDSPGWREAARQYHANRSSLGGWALAKASVGSKSPMTAKAELVNDAGPHEGSRLLSEIEAFLSRFVIYPSEATRVAHVLWIAHSHLMGVWESTPRLAFLSPEPASGKTRALECSLLLVPTPVEAINVTPAYLFRKVGSKDGLPTILYDEIDTVFGPKAKENEEIRGLLNAGHRRGAVAGRCVVKGNNVETEEIPAYCAVALAGLGWLPDTLLSRSIVVRMRKRKPGESVEAFRRRVHEPQGHALRDRLARWATATADKLIDVWPVMPSGVEDRNADMWEPLVAVADAVGGDWPRRARAAAVTLVTSAREIEPSLGIRLLADLRTVFGNRSEMATEAILRGLYGLEEAPWNDLKGKPLNDRALAQRLRQYDVKPTVLAGGAQRGYRREDLRDAWERYLPLLSPPDESVTSVTGVTGGNAPDVTLVTDVTLVADDERGAICAQCGAGPSTSPPSGAPTVRVKNGSSDVWVHATGCYRFWVRDHPQ